MEFLSTGKQEPARATMVQSTAAIN